MAMFPFFLMGRYIQFSLLNEKNYRSLMGLELCLHRFRWLNITVWTCVMERWPWGGGNSISLEPHPPPTNIVGRNHLIFNHCEMTYWNLWEQSFNSIKVWGNIFFLLKRWKLKKVFLMRKTEGMAPLVDLIRLAQILSSPFHQDNKNPSSTTQNSKFCIWHLLDSHLIAVAFWRPRLKLPDWS